MAQDPAQIAAMMELLGGKGQQAPAQMSPGLVDMIHQETFAPQQQNTQVAENNTPRLSLPVDEALRAITGQSQDFSDKFNNATLQTTLAQPANSFPLMSGLIDTGIFRRHQGAYPPARFPDHYKFPE